MRDFLPEQMKKKQFIEDKIRRVFEKYGYEPLQSPVVEDFDLLAAKGSGGEAIKEEIYYFKDKGDRELGLRYDMTVPLARIVASNPSLPRPFKRYVIGQVYRYDRPQAKRYREFTQADWDIIGVKSVLADFEVIQVAIDLMRSLGFEFTVKVNNRIVLEELAIKMGVKEEQIKEAFKSIDKLDKISEKGVRDEFKSKGIDDSVLEQIFVNSFDEVKARIGETESLKELEQLLELAKDNDYNEVKFELSLARGLEYYTGVVFEISINDGPSVAGGGRYDKLIGLYGGQDSPAVGCSFGVDRLFDNLEKELVMGPNTDVFIIPMSDNAFSFSTKLSRKLRETGISVELDLMGRNVKKNFEYVNKKGISFVIVIGENEVKSGKFKIKSMGTREEKEFLADDLAAVMKFVKHA